jgi:hypothetical protein
VGGQGGRALEGFAAHPALEAALLPEETRPQGVRCRWGLEAWESQAGRRTGPGRDALRKRTLHWGGLKGRTYRTGPRNNLPTPPPHYYCSCLICRTEAWGLTGLLWDFFSFNLHSIPLKISLNNCLLTD